MNKTNQPCVSMHKHTLFGTVRSFMHFRFVFYDFLFERKIYSLSPNPFRPFKPSSELDAVRRTIRQLHDYQPRPGHRIRKRPAPVSPYSVTAAEIRSCYPAHVTRITVPERNIIITSVIRTVYRRPSSARRGNNNRNSQMQKKKKTDEKKNSTRTWASPVRICRQIGFQKRPRTRIERSRRFAASTTRTGDCSFSLKKGNPPQLCVQQLDFKEYIFEIISVNANPHNDSPVFRILSKHF